MSFEIRSVEVALTQLAVSVPLSDLVTFTVGKWSFQVPRLRLSAIDEHFEKALKGEFVEAKKNMITLECSNELSEEAQEHLVAFMLTGNCAVSERTAFDLLDLSVVNSIKPLRDVCAEFLFSIANAEEDPTGYTALIRYTLLHENSELANQFLNLLISKSFHRKNNGHYVAALECILTVKQETKEKNQFLDNLLWYFFEHITCKANMWAKLHFSGSFAPNATKLLHEMRYYREKGFQPSTSQDKLRELTLIFSEHLYQNNDTLASQLKRLGSNVPFSCQRLVIKRSDFIKDSDFIDVTAHLAEDLLRINISDCFGIKSLPNFAFRNLVVLEATDCDITDEGLRMLSPSCKDTLRELNISGNRRITTFEGVPLGKLEKINASRTGVDFAGLETLATLCRETLKHVRVIKTPLRYMAQEKINNLFAPHTTIDVHLREFWK